MPTGREQCHPQLDRAIALISLLSTFKKHRSPSSTPFSQADLHKLCQNDSTDHNKGAGSQKRAVRAHWGGQEELGWTGRRTRERVSSAGAQSTFDSSKGEATKKSNVRRHCPFSIPFSYLHSNARKPSAPPGLPPLYLGIWGHGHNGRVNRRPQL